jgi:hypothetical protein
VLQRLFDSGLTARSVDKFHLGVKESPPGEREGREAGAVVCYPVISYAGEALGRYGHLAVPATPGKRPGESARGAGRPRTYYSGAAAGRRTLLVADDPWQLWALDQQLGGTELGESAVIICPSHGQSVPDEWRTAGFWSGWDAVYLVHSNTGHHDATSRSLLRYCGRDVFRVLVPGYDGRGWDDFFRSGGAAEQLVELLKAAPVFSPQPPENDGGADAIGEFAASPVNINGAFVNGHLYYPFTVERREVETVGRSGGERLVTSYVTKVVRSDGAVLDVVRLAAPRGTPRDRQVLALTDGTRIEKEPQPSHYATWQLDGIQAFIKAVRNSRAAPHRPLRELLADITAHLRRSVWLPYDDDYAVLALYVALSFVYQVFDAIPLLMVRGEKGTGKSELGDAVARVSCNATIIGQGSAASVIRLLNEARGLVVLDDLEAIGRVMEDSAFGDINQMLKLGYKKRTGRKAITDKNGKTTVFDFYSPKVINNTRGADPILGSRMLYVQTRRIPDALRESTLLMGSEPDELIRLRNELHAWGMVDARLVHECYTRLMDVRRDRQGEITAPLKAVAQLSGDEEIQASLEAALERQYVRTRQLDNPHELLGEAIANCIRRGALDQLSAIQISLELRQLAEENLDLRSSQDPPPWLSPEWIGHQLRALQIRDPRKAVRRHRLYGIITRIYDLRAEYVQVVLDDLRTAGRPSPEKRSPFDFCEKTTCSACAYAKICGLTIQGLKTSKSLNRGKSGRKAVELNM